MDLNKLNKKLNTLLCCMSLHSLKQIAENDFFTTVEILGTSFRKHLCFCYTVEQDGVQFVITDLNKKVLYTEQLKKPTLSNLSMLKIKTLLQNI